MATIICRLSFYREYHGMSQRELAAEVGTGSSTISKVESAGRLPNVILAIKIARVLQTTVEDLWLWEER